MPRILMITSEAAPFAKTGGLADVLGALPPALAKLGEEVAVVMPRYGSVRTGWVHADCRWNAALGGSERVHGGDRSSGA